MLQKQSTVIYRSTGQRSSHIVRCIPNNFQERKQVRLDNLKEIAKLSMSKRSKTCQDLSVAIKTFLDTEWELQRSILDEVVSIVKKDTESVVKNNIEGSDS